MPPAARAHRFAEGDTPENVHVPNTMAGLAVWAAGRFGSGILIAAVCVWGMAHVYQDQRKLTQQVIISFNEQTKVTERNSAAIQQLTRAVELLRDQRATSGPQQPVITHP